jgi:hypothetical protein
MCGIIDWRKCVVCGEPFDIDTSKEKCPGCRNVSILKNKGGENNVLDNY